MVHGEPGQINHLIGVTYYLLSDLVVEYEFKHFLLMGFRFGKMQQEDRARWSYDVIRG